MKPEDHPEIWNDALEHAMPPGFSDQALDQLLRTARRRRRQRHALRALGAAAAVVTVMMILSNKPILPLPSQAGNPRTPSPETIEVRRISDEELLTRFPHQPLVMVGTGNAKTLVLLDPKQE